MTKKIKYIQEGDNEPIFLDVQHTFPGTSSDAYLIAGQNADQKPWVLKVLKEVYDHDTDLKRQELFKASVERVRNYPENPHFVPYNRTGKVEIGTNWRPAVGMDYHGDNLWMIVGYLEHHDFIGKPANSRVTNIIRGFAHTVALNLLESVSSRLSYGNNGDLLPPNVVVKGIETALKAGTTLEEVVAHLKDPKVRMIDYGMDTQFRNMTQTVDDYIGFFAQGLSDDKQDVFCAVSIWIWLLSLTKKTLTKMERVDLANFDDGDYLEHFFDEDIPLIKEVVEIGRKRLGRIRSAAEVRNKIRAGIDDFRGFEIKERKADLPAEGQTTLYLVTRAVDGYNLDNLKPELTLDDLAAAEESYRRLLPGGNQNPQAGRVVNVSDSGEQNELKDIFNGLVDRFVTGLNVEIDRIGTEISKKVKEIDDSNKRRDELSEKRKPLEEKADKFRKELDDFFTSGETMNIPSELLERSDLENYATLSESIAKENTTQTELGLARTTLQGEVTIHESQKKQALGLKK